ncbi:putative glyoxalase superfamily protein PhnB [Marmoricola sp. URHA0025 HA25]
MTVQTNRSAPPVTVTPVLPYPDVREAVAWLGEAFGFEERVRVGEAHRAQLRVGADGAVIVAQADGDRQPPSAGQVPHILKVRVPDVDAAFARATAAGASVVEEPTSWEYGERSCVVQDPAGHSWELTQTVRDVEPEEWGGVTVAPW